MDKIGTMFEGGQQVRKLLMEKVIEQGGMDRAALVFGMVELIIDLRPDGMTMRAWVNKVGSVFGHFARQKDGAETKH